MNKSILISAAWGVVLIVLFSIAIGTDTNAPNPDSEELFTYIVNTDRGSFLSGMAGPIYTAANSIAGEHAGVILDDTWGSGNGAYKFGFVVGVILLITGTGPIASLLAIVRSMLD